MNTYLTLSEQTIECNNDDLIIISKSVSVKDSYDKEKDCKSSTSKLISC